jgi:hypothetical protein
VEWIHLAQDRDQWRTGNDQLSECLVLKDSPNIAAEWLTLLVRIAEIPCSDLGPETGHLDYGFLRFPLAPRSECRATYLSLGHDRFLPYPF